MLGQNIFRQLLAKSIVKKQQKLFSKAQFYIDQEKKYGCNNYAPMEVVLEKGKGIHVWDVDGKQYLDFLSAYSAVNQGHLHPKIMKTFIDQAQKLTLVSRAFYNKNLGDCQKFLHEKFGYDKALLMNSGVEAGESAVKFARRWGYQAKGIPSNEAKILFAYGNFWGRSIAACGSSEDPSRYKDFGPFNLNFELIEYNNIEALKQKFESDKNIAAYMVEPIQGERGVIIPSDNYFKQVEELCKKHNVLLIIDEIQTGLGRTGKMMCHNWYGIRPDMVCLGKALSGGVMPVSAVLADNKVMDLIKPGDHGSTYGGNPLGASVSVTALQVIEEENMCENSYEMGQLLMNGLKQVKRDYIKEIRGKGLFTAVEFSEEAKYSKFTAKALCQIMLKKGLLAKPTHESTIRFSPPLIINKEQINQALNIINESLVELEKQ